MLLFTALTVLGTDDKNLDELMLKVKNSDLSALEELYKLTKTGIYSFALSVLKNPADAEDVLHNTYLSVWVSAHMYESEGKPMAWLITIAKNHCYRVFRNRKWNDDKTDASETAAEDFSTASDNKATIWQYIGLLSDDERQIIVLHAVSGFKHREIAELLNLPLSTILSKYHRGIKKLKKSLIHGGAFNE